MPSFAGMVQGPATIAGMVQGPSTLAGLGLGQHAVRGGAPRARPGQMVHPSDAEKLQRQQLALLAPQLHAERLLSQGHTVDPVTGHELLADPQRQIQLRRSQQDLQAALGAFNRGEIDQRQLAQVQHSLSRQYGLSTLIHHPEGRELMGMEQEYQEALQQKVQEKAEQHGLPPEAFKSNPRTGEAELNQEWFFIEDYKSKKAIAEVAPFLEASKQMRSEADKRFSAEVKVHEKLHSDRLRKKMDPDSAAVEFQRRMDGSFTRLMAAYRKADEFVGQQRQPAAPGIPGPEQAPAPPPVTHPKLPPGVRIAAKFDTVEDVVASRPAPGSYFVLGPDLFRVTADGQLQEVQ
jgi:hypothetical protein